MRYSISVGVMVVAFAVGCGSDKSTGPDLDEGLIGEWDNDSSAIQFFIGGVYEQITTKENQLWLTEGSWNLKVGDFLVLKSRRSALLSDLENWIYSTDTVTAKASISGKRLTLEFVSSNADSAFTVKLTRKN
jgi:hypothetical protein